MKPSLGTVGIAGVLMLLAGIGIIASQDLIIATGIALILVGIGLVAQGLITGMLKSFGMY